MDNDTKNVYQRVHAIMADVGAIKKDKTNTHFNYEYLSEQAIKGAIQPLLIKHGVMFTVNVPEQVREGTLTFAKIEYTFTNIDDPTQQIKGTFVAQGADNQDKGIWKAITGAIKYILTSTLLIPTGDDPEVTGKHDGERFDSPPKAPVAKANASNPASKKQKDYIYTLLKERGLEPEWVKDEGFGVPLNAEDGSEVIKQLLEMPKAGEGVAAKDISEDDIPVIDG